MARKAGNKIDADVADSYVQRIESLHADIAAEQDKAKAVIEMIKGDLHEVYLDAREAGLALKPLKAMIRIRELSRKQDAVRNKLDQDQLAELEQLAEALGEFAYTPLGAAALAAAGSAEA